MSDRRIDSHSVKTAGPCAQQEIDGGKKIKGRKRHRVMDTQGTLVQGTVHEVNQHNTVGGAIFFKRLCKISDTQKRFRRFRV
ncbi:hypothetical protein [Holospora curviuscula]|uniref:Transposase IS4-like domain-containing protein n=1 Tax=Holospora curviuscula TaxID=1082868 RepID=A0A2S5R8A1_9PROT|nr:hypothetical protein [Holospora curviuscula]PPE03517.1 hypothetical protein HCUR_01060 [Holospora curviuscula]